MPKSSSDSGPLSCPRCAISYPLSERFCAQCGMPLVYAGQREAESLTEAQQRARKVKPQYTRGDPVRVAGGRNQAEAELIQNMLLEEGIPSFTRRTRGFDVPDFLAAGPRDILVPQAAYEAARGLLAEAELEGSEAEVAAGEADTPAGRLIAGLLVAFAGAFAIVWVLYQLTG